MVVTRFAPSPTGFLHVGGVRTALFSYLYAKQNSGKFVLRIEDTDEARNKKEYDDGILAGMKWLGLSYDEFYRQSERKQIYKQLLEKLISEGKAYVSKEKVEKEGDRPEVIRFKNLNKKVAFEDVIRGTIEFDTTELKDFIIAKSLEEPVFHFVVVVDDFQMGITHVIRGEDHISNTPRQILIQEALGAPRPMYAHLPLMLAADRSKLSKRKHGERVSLEYYQKQDYLPGAFINYLALVGWNPGTDQEIFTLQELVEKFDLSKVQKAGAIFNEEKLKWVNKEHIKKLAPEILNQKIKENLAAAYPEITDEHVKKLSGIVLERINTFGDIRDMAVQGEWDYFFKEPEYTPEALLWKGKGDLAQTKVRLEKTLELISAVDEHGFNKDTIKNAVWAYAEQEGKGEVLWPTRFALSGREKSPDPFVLAELLGKEKTIHRLEAAIGKI